MKKNELIKIGILGIGAYVLLNKISKTNQEFSFLSPVGFSENVGSALGQSVVEIPIGVIKGVGNSLLDLFSSSYNFGYNLALRNK
jgi:hypothetical protein